MPRIRADLLLREKKWLKEGKHLREKKNYEPFLTVRDVPSRGYRNRITSYSVGRLHHLLSRPEQKVFYLADHELEVTDIREQYPLIPSEETQQIAKELGLKHPAMRGKLHVMTTDFLLTYDDQRLKAVSVKTSKDLEDARTMEKIAIEQAYWRKREVEFKVITEENLPLEKVAALAWIHGFESYEMLGFSQDSRDQVKDLLIKRIRQNKALSLNKICLSVDDLLSLEPGSALALVRHLFCVGIWKAPLDQGINPLKPLILVEEAES